MRGRTSVGADRLAMLVTEMLEQHLRHEIHARPAFLEIVGNDRDPQTHVTPPAPGREQRLEELQMLARDDRPRELRLHARPAAPREIASSGFRHEEDDRWRASTPAASASGTSSPASPTTCGISPLSLATTGTPQAIASINMRPNCSRHRIGGLARRAQHRHRVQPLRNVAVRHAGDDPHAVRVCRGKVPEIGLERTAAHKERAPWRRDGLQRSREH